MTEARQDVLEQLSDALAARAAAASALVVAIRARGEVRSGILWRTDVAVASEQVLPKVEEAEIVLSDGRSLKARVAGRDRGTNVAVLRLERPVEISPPQAAEPRLGGLALACGAGADGAPFVRLAVMRTVGPAWRSLGGGQIDCRIALDLRLSGNEEGGPVIVAAGGLLGMSTAGPRGRALVIPASTIDRVLDPLLAEGKVARGWLGLALHPVALPQTSAGPAGQDRGLMAVRVAADGPAAKAGVLPGDILLRVGAAPAIYAREIGRGLGPESVGRAIDLELIRAGSRLTVAALISERPTG